MQKYRKSWAERNKSRIFTIYYRAVRNRGCVDFVKYSISITPIIRLDIKEGRVRVTYTVQNYDVLRDVSGGWISPVRRDDRTYGDSKRKMEDKTYAYLYDEQWEITRRYPFVENDAQKRTCAKALVMTHAYSNAVMDKVEEALKNGIVGNEDDEW